MLGLVLKLGQANNFVSLTCVDMGDLHPLSDRGTVLFARERQCTNKLIAFLDESAMLQEPTLGCIILYNELALRQAKRAEAWTGRRPGRRLTRPTGCSGASV